jgi:hypothetical protein
MLQFIFLACIAASPQDCREVDGPVFGRPITETVCMLEGPAITGAWLQRNPGWVVREWTCRPSGELDA